MMIFRLYFRVNFLNTHKNFSPARFLGLCLKHPKNCERLQVTWEVKFKCLPVFLPVLKTMMKTQLSNPWADHSLSGFLTFRIGLKGLFHAQKHKAPGACTKLPRRLATNLRYETKPSRPVVGNTKLGELYWVLSDNKTSLQDFAIRAKTDRKKQI